MGVVSQLVSTQESGVSPMCPLLRGELGKAPRSPSRLETITLHRCALGAEVHEGAHPTPEHTAKSEPGCHFFRRLLTLTPKTLMETLFSKGNLRALGVLSPPDCTGVM